MSKTVLFQTIQFGKSTALLEPHHQMSYPGYPLEEFNSATEKQLVYSTVPAEICK